MSAEQWHLDRCGSAVVDGQTVPACHLSEETTHDPRVTLTEAEQEAIWSGLRRARREEAPIPLAAESHKTHVLWAVSESVEQIIAARLAPIRALAEEATERAYWDISLREMLTVQATGPERAKVPPHWRTQAESEALVPVDALRNALDAPQDAPREPVGGEQGAEVAGGRSEGERAGEAILRVLRDLAERADDAVRHLDDLHATRTSDMERARLTGKSEGVALVGGYIDEAIRQEGQ